MTIYSTISLYMTDNTCHYEFVATQMRFNWHVTCGKYKRIDRIPHVVSASQQKHKIKRDSNSIYYEKKNLLLLVRRMCTCPLQIRILFKSQIMSSKPRKERLRALTFTKSPVPWIIIHPGNLFLSSFDLIHKQLLIYRNKERITRYYSTGEKSQRDRRIYNSSIY